MTDKHNAALRCEQRLAILERSENAKRCESLLNALLGQYLTQATVLINLLSTFRNRFEIENLNETLNNLTSITPYERG
ncbi:hypothetical protein AKH05_23010 [Vibrio parahaemolyticus]|nr:hypothetical protein AKH05_23010 [Vibrio parahaemolyticus]